MLLSNEIVNKDKEKLGGKLNKYVMSTLTLRCLWYPLRKKQCIELVILNAVQSKVLNRYLVLVINYVRAENCRGGQGHPKKVYRVWDFNQWCEIHRGEHEGPWIGFMCIISPNGFLLVIWKLFDFVNFSISDLLLVKNF